MALRAEHIGHRYGGREAPWVLRDVTLSLDAGEALAVAGASGSGKSTFLQVLGGLLRPQRGRVPRCGERVGVLFQFPEVQLFAETVLADVAYGPSRQGLSRQEAEEAAAHALRAVGLSESRWGLSPRSLSGGERRRTALAGVLALDPGYLLLDEPTAGLDGEARESMLDLLRSLKEAGKGILWITHRMEEVAMLADRVLVLGAGEVRFAGGVTDFFREGARFPQWRLLPPFPTALWEALRRRGAPVGNEPWLRDEEAVKGLGELMRHA